MDLSYHPVSFNRCTGEVNVFELVTTLSGKLFPVQYLRVDHVATRRTVSVNSTFVKFRILTDLITNTRLLINSLLHYIVCRAATNN
jgi:hypothetical protein